MCQNEGHSTTHVLPCPRSPPSKGQGINEKRKTLPAAAGLEPAASATNTCRGVPERAVHAKHPRTRASARGSGYRRLGGAVAAATAVFRVTPRDAWPARLPHPIPIGVSLLSHAGQVLIRAEVVAGFRRRAAAPRQAGPRQARVAPPPAAPARVARVAAIGHACTSKNRNSGASIASCASGSCVVPPPHRQGAARLDAGVQYLSGIQG